MRFEFYCRFMEFQMPEAEVINALPEVSIEGVRVGDLLFFSREGSLQNMFWAVNDIWLHTAIVVSGPLGLQTAEVGVGPNVFARPLGAALDRYELTAIGRPTLSQPCVAAAAEWAASQVGEQQDYAWDDFVLACLVAVTRKGLPSSMLGHLGSALTGAVDDPDKVSGSSRTCAGFVYEAYARQGDACEIQVEMRDTSRLGILESGTSHPSYQEFLDLSPEEQEEVLAETSLYEIVQPELAREEMMEGVGESRITKDQLGRTLRTAVRIVDEYRSGQGGPNHAHGVPGRWTSPTDLWRAGHIGYKARLRH